MTTVVPVVVGDDWKAAFLWKALYDAGVYVNVALHPAVPPAGALLRTSVMATHDHDTLDQALEIFAEAKQRFESRARLAAARARGPLLERSAGLSTLAQDIRPQKKHALSACPALVTLLLSAPMS